MTRRTPPTVRPDRSANSAPVVFLGPSLPLAAAEPLLRADYRPPIRRGDLELVESGRVALILDGEFHQNLPVSPKEIVRALDAGVTVVGAASMGAIRAAETGPAGMIGVGRVFEAYRGGQIEGDDEVALTYCPFSFEPRTVPLVNVRFWLDDLVAAGLISPVERSTCRRRARRVFYADRTPEQLSRVLDACLGGDRVRSIHAQGLGMIPDVKAEDARAALVAVAHGIELSGSPTGESAWIRTVCGS